MSNQATKRRSDEATRRPEDTDTRGIRGHRVAVSLRFAQGQAPCRCIILRSPRGLAYVDVVVSTAILGIAVVAALNAFGAFAKGSTSDREMAAATELAAQLAAEIRMQAFEDPGENPTFGPEASETNGTRASFDDVDDYHNWSATPPQRQDGTIMTDYEDYTREAAVELYGSNDLKKITVTIRKNGQTLAEIALLRSRNDAEEQ